MDPGQENTSQHAQETASNPPVPISDSTIYAYNLNDSKTPGGLKVRWKVRIVTGEKARRYDTRQNEAIKEMLLWSRRHPPHGRH